MNLLLDTHILLWWLADDPELPRTALEAIASSENAVSVSAVSAWEIAINQAIGRLDAPDDLADAIEANDFGQLPITIGHALAAGRLPAHHPDPFDRMLVAQAQLEQLVLVTVDPRLDLYGVDRLPLD